MKMCLPAGAEAVQEHPIEDVVPLAKQKIGTSVTFGSWKHCRFIGLDARDRKNQIDKILSYGDSGTVSRVTAARIVTFWERHSISAERNTHVDVFDSHRVIFANRDLG